MLAFGYDGKTVALEAWIGFIIGMGAWFHILKDIFMREAGGVAGECSQAQVQAGCTSLRDLPGVAGGVAGNLSEAVKTILLSSGMCGLS